MAGHDGTLQESCSANTRRAHDLDWHRLSAWAQDRGVTDLPTTPELTVHIPIQPGNAMVLQPRARLLGISPSRHVIPPTKLPIITKISHH